ncbi:hypothetical protein GCM10022380_81090 [Amycolatopsis tucumanensis]|uniref:Uncharacterized protein n=1 Tax=Amycolatopsis tucumanensis TaxID=401106 RepID=A0ABP7JQI0_9PSEU
MNRNASTPRTPAVHVIDPMADPAPLPEITVDHFMENGCAVVCVVIDPADAQQLLYGTVTRPDGRLAGTYYPADRVRGDHWRIVAADGTHYHAASEYDAVEWLTTSNRETSTPDTGTVECGHCSQPLEITRQQWERDNVAPCPCGGHADLNFHRRHAEWGENFQPG